MYQGSVVEASIQEHEISKMVITPSCNHGPSNNHVATFQSASASPAGLLEKSSLFHPESYTSRSQISNVIITALREESFTGRSSINIYRVLYFRSTRSWNVLDVYLEVPISSNYWRFTRVSKHQHPNLSGRTAHGMPMPLLRKVAKSLDAHEDTGEDFKVHFRLAEGNELEVVYTESTTRPRDIMLAVSAQRTEQAILNAVYHMDCPVVDVRGVIRLAPIELPHRFLSSFNQGSLVEEVLSSNRPPTANFCFNIQLPQRLRHDPGFPRLAGVVVDNKENLIKSYLVKWSDVACEFILTRASDPKLHYPWQRIESWSRQLL
jgi:hypothetical protein